MNFHYPQINFFLLLQVFLSLLLLQLMAKSETCLVWFLWLKLTSNFSRQTTTFTLKITSSGGDSEKKATKPLLETLMFSENL